jgi:hypothetical protein
MNTPIRKPIPGYEGLYDADDTGAIIRVRTGRVLKTYTRKNGYEQVKLTKGNVGETRAVHGLVAAAFLGPRPIGAQVNHIDHVKAHNAPSNLEYVTALGNCRAYQRHVEPGWVPQLERGRAVRPIVAEHPVTRHVVRFASIKDAVELGFADSGISLVLTGRLKTHKGYVFKDA